MLSPLNEFSSNLEAHSEPSQTSKMELYAKIVNGFRPFIFFEKSSIWVLNTYLRLLRLNGALTQWVEQQAR